VSCRVLPIFMAWKREKRPKNEKSCFRKWNMGRTRGETQLVPIWPPGTQKNDPKTKNHVSQPQKVCESFFFSCSQW
jgi:hypothetical protein